MSVKRNSAGLLASSNNIKASTTTVPKSSIFYKGELFFRPIMFRLRSNATTTPPATDYLAYSYNGLNYYHVLEYDGFKSANTNSANYVQPTGITTPTAGYDLSPFAKEFVPIVPKKTPEFKASSTLNPNAAEFIPAVPMQSIPQLTPNIRCRLRREARVNENHSTETPTSQSNSEGTAPATVDNLRYFYQGEIHFAPLYCPQPSNLYTVPSCYYYEGVTQYYPILPGNY